MRMAFLILVLALAACATTHPSRNMADMSAEQLVRELSQVQP